MQVYRFTKIQFADGLSCEGARRVGGRWNSKGMPVLYCATHESLAMLELRVHSPHPHPRERWRFVLEIPDEAVQRLPPEQWPKGWNTLPPRPASKHLGDRWLRDRTSLGLLVPSVLALDESNLLINPAHERFKDVHIVSKKQVTLDRRLYVVAG